MKIVAILLPCFNESEGLSGFNDLLLAYLQDLPYKFELIYIDDASFDTSKDVIKKFNSKLKNINISLLSLNYNMGHQKAISQGLLYVSEKRFDSIVIMDSDGEDDPGALKELLKHDDNDLVQVSRGKRNENWQFKFMYFVYRNLFYFLIGKKIDSGNFCLLKPQLVKAANENSFVHLAAFLDNQNCTRAKIKWDRKERISGTSKMNFQKLFYHAVNSFVENAESLLFVFIKLSIFLFVFIVLLLIYILYNKYVIQLAVPGWSSTLMATVLNSLLISLGVFVIGSLQLNVLRKQSSKKRKTSFIKEAIVENWRN